jgi:putative tryptophan/tyrosine transport system substrate-binding protein
MAIHIRRREFIATLGGAIAAWPLTVRAQQPSMPIAGLLGATSAQGYAAQLEAFRRGLAEAGFVEGRDVMIEYRWADDHYERLAELAADLAVRQVSVIATMGGNAARLRRRRRPAQFPSCFTAASTRCERGLPRRSIARAAT